MKKKVLIITSSIGNGHLTAALNTQKILNHLYEEKVDVEVVNILEYLSRALNRTIRSLYYAALSISPRIYKLLFESSDNEKGVKGLSMLNFPLAYRSIRKLIEKSKPDLIFSTWPVFDSIIRRYARNTKFISMITDSGNVHYAWISGKADFYIVTDKPTKKTLQKMGIEKEKIKDLGFPVSSEFFKNVDKTKLLKKYQLDENIFSILIIANPRKTRRITEIVRTFSEYGESIQLIAVAGKNKRVYKKIKKMNLPKNIHTIEWTDSIAELMHISDIILTKSGGATVQECIAAQKPPIIYDSLPGQEEGNVDFIEKYKIGNIMTKDNPTDIVCKTLQLAHPKSAQYHTLVKNIKNIHKKNSTQNIGAFIGKLLNL